MIGVVESNGNDLRWIDGCECAQPFRRRGFFFKGGRAENIPLQTENFPIHRLGIENFVALLKPADCCHKVGRFVTNGETASQASISAAMPWVPKSPRNTKRFCRVSVSLHYIAPT